MVVNPEDSFSHIKVHKMVFCYRCVEQVKNSQYIDLAHDLEIDKAIMFLKQKDFNQAIETLKSFEKKDSKVACTAATNLSFLYFLVSIMAISWFQSFPI